MKFPTTKIAIFFFTLGLAFPGWAQQSNPRAGRILGSAPLSQAEVVREPANPTSTERRATVEWRWLESEEKKTTAPPTAPPRLIRLVQVDEDNDDLSSLFEDATDEPEEPKAADNGRSILDLLEDTAPNQEDSTDTSELDELLNQAKQLIQQEDAAETPFTDDPPANSERDADELQRRLRQELNSLIPEETTRDVPQRRPPGDANFDEPTSNNYDDLVDPVPQPVYRPHRNTANQPYTLAGILSDDDQVDPYREQEFCRQVWECAGGRNQSPCQRLKREWRRNQKVMYGGGMLAIPVPGFLQGRLGGGIGHSSMSGGCTSCTGGCSDGSDWNPGAHSYEFSQSQRVHPMPELGVPMTAPSAEILELQPTPNN